MMIIWPFELSELCRRDCNVRLSLYYWTHWCCWWICHFKKHRFIASCAGLL